jgi:hypothetical protein
MNEPAIDDLLTESLYGWYSEVSQWMPDSAESVRTCEGCHAELTVVIDPEAWPHELIDSLASVIDRTVRQVTESHLEECGGDPLAAESDTRAKVMSVLVLHGGDIGDVLEQCIRHRLEAFEMFELELAELDGF